MNKKVIAIAAALAVVLTSVAVAVPSMQSTDAAFKDVTAAPVAYAKEGNVRAILYQDKVLMVDISGVATLNKDDHYKVEVTKTSGTYSDSKGISVSQLVANNGRIMINVDGNTADSETPLIDNTTSTTPNLFVKVTTMTGSSVCSQIALTYKTTNGGLDAMSMVLYKNNDEGWDADKIGVVSETVLNVPLQNRGVKVGLNETQKTIQNMTASIDTSTESNSNHTLTDPNGKLRLIGWSEDSQKVNGTVDVTAEEMTVEDLLYEAGDAGAITDTNLIKLYAVYSANNYNVYIFDSSKSGKDRWVISDLVLKGNTVVKQTPYKNQEIATASVTSQISSIGFGILSIELKNIEDNTNIYSFDITAYGGINEDGDVNTEALDENKVKLVAISKNVYKISDVKSNLYIKISVNVTASSAGNLYFDSVKNVIGTSIYHGEANLSLDLLSTTKLVSGSTLKIDGTIYTESADYIRTYSSLANYMTLSDVKINPISVKMDGTTCTESGRISDVTLTLYETDNFTEADNYDMSLKLADGYSIYALQGTWTNGTKTTNTPWALADN